VVLPTIGFGGDTPVEVQTKIYDVLQAAVTVIWCISMVILFIDVLIIIRRYSTAFESTKLAHPGVFYMSSLLGGVAAFVGIVATLSGAWTPLIPNDSGSVSILGATIAYGAWFYWIAGIAIVSLAAGAILFVLGRGSRPEVRAEPMAGIAGSR